MVRIYFIAFVGILFSLNACAQKKETQTKGTERVKASTQYEIEKTEAEWRSLLSEEQYRVAREEGTERAFTGKFYKHNEKGTYTCVCCNHPLFESATKFSSGTGWPSFWEPVDSTHINYVEDMAYGWNRVEVECKRCGAHLGHVFEDGPKPTGLRYCINSASLKFEKD